MRLINRFPRVLASACLAIAAIVACHLDQEVRNETYFDLSKYTDSLDDFDSIRVEFLDNEGNTVDAAFRTDDIRASTLAQMPIPHYQGDSLRIRIFGWEGNRLVYEVEFGYDGALNHIYSRAPVVLPGSRLTLVLLDTSILVGDSALFPDHKLTPTELIDPGVDWISLDTEQLAARGLRYAGIKAGSARLKAVLKNDTAKWAIINVSVLDSSTRIEVKFPSDRFELILGEPIAFPSAEVSPKEVGNSVDYRLLDSTHASISGLTLKGISEGLAILVASSRIKPDACDSLRITVRRPLVSSLALMPDTVRLFTGGKRETLHVKVEPPLAAQEIDWRITDPALAVLLPDGSLGARKAAGRTRITALSRSDSTRLDSSLVLVVRDMPQLSVGRDTAISLGGQAVFRITCSQEFGEILEFRVDLDGDSVYEKSFDQALRVFPMELWQKFDKVGEFRSRFYVRDSEGNDTVVVRRIKVVLGPVINITSPPPNSYTNKEVIDVEWTVNDLPQSDSVREVLKSEGANTVTRTAKDAAGKVFSAEITVFRDQTAPDKPAVAGPEVTRDRTPTWTWKAAQAGGAFRYRVDSADLVGAPIIKDTAFNPPFPLAEGKHLFFLQERDIAGNWSPLASFETIVDLTPPKPPGVQSVKILTNSTRPTWTWSAGGEGNGTFRYKLDDSIFITGSTETTAKEFAPSQALNDGPHILFVQERDVAGNWSHAGSYSLTIDTTPPSVPLVASESGGLKPNWSWKSGGGGSGWYRFKLDDSLMTLNARTSTDTQYLVSTNLSDGPHVLYVQEQDAAGNWSKLGSAMAIAFLPLNTLSDAEIGEGFELLFDGTLAKFQENFTPYAKGVNTNTTPIGSGWSLNAAEKAIVSGPSVPDIRSKAIYRDFDLRMSYRNNGNQGVFYRFTTMEGSAYESGIEVGIENDTNYVANRSAGSAYDFFAPKKKMYRPYSTGLWNDLRIVVKEDSVEHWMNGELIVSFRYHSDEWWQAFDASKYQGFKDFAMTNGDRKGPVPDGYIGFQGNHGGVWAIRNLRINSTAPKLGPP